MVRMVGPMSKRKPASSSTAALPPSHGTLLEQHDRVAAGRQRAGRRQPAQAAADHRRYDPISSALIQFALPRIGDRRATHRRLNRPLREPHQSAIDRRRDPSSKQPRW